MGIVFFKKHEYVFIFFDSFELKCHQQLQFFPMEDRDPFMLHV